jgi:uncharacterized coiled-coil protein SlyX
MKMSSRSHNGGLSFYPGAGGSVIALLSMAFGLAQLPLNAQQMNQQSLNERFQQLSQAVVNTQAELERSQRKLEEMRKELNELQSQLAESRPNAQPLSTPESVSVASSSQGTPEDLAAAVQDIRERQAMAESQIATHEQTKVETESRYSLKVTGLVLMNGFVNTGAVDMPATPSVAIPGAGSAGASVRQTVIGFDAAGPHLMGADSFADFRVDFAGNPAFYAVPSAYPEYTSSNSTYLRLRTLHAGLAWPRTQALFALDRPLLSPDTPTSLTAVAEPALAWSGNLWTWNPQAILTHNFGPPGYANLQVQAAYIDPQDAPISAFATSQAIVQPTSAEQTSLPGVEARVALLGTGRDDERNQIGVGGHFARHHTSINRSFDSWAATLDVRRRLFAGLQLSGSFYRGLGLGGLGGGAYKDFVYKPNTITGGYFFRALDDVGGWAQLKGKVDQRLEFNGAFGMDNVFSAQMRRYYLAGGTMYQNLTINRTFTGNVIYTPSAYLLFSVEYRHLLSSPITDASAQSNIIGLGAGFKF